VTFFIVLNNKRKMEEKEPLIRTVIRRYSDSSTLLDEPYIYSIIAQFVNAPTFFKDEEGVHPRLGPFTTRRYYIQYGNDEPLLHNAERPAVSTRFHHVDQIGDDEWYLWGHFVSEDEFLSFEDMEDVVMWAARNGFVDVLGYLPSCEFELLMDEAIERGQLLSVMFLIDHCGFDVNTSFVSAAEDGQLEIVQWLVDHRGANVHSDKNFALEAAAANGHIDMVQFLVRRGAFITRRAILSARSYGFNELSEWLLEQTNHT
jgi:hypothetical protein